MTEAVRTPSPAGLKRLLKVSTFQCGTEFTPTELDSKTISLKELVYGILKEQSMTTRELVGCLLSKPYDVPVTDLQHIALALDSLRERGLLSGGFGVHNDNLDIEPVFQTLPLERGTRS